MLEVDINKGLPKRRLLIPPGVLILEGRLLGARLKFAHNFLWVIIGRVPATSRILQSHHLTSQITLVCPTRHIGRMVHIGLPLSWIAHPDLPIGRPVYPSLPVGLSVLWSLLTVWPALASFTFNQPALLNLTISHPAYPGVPVGWIHRLVWLVRQSIFPV